MPEPTPDPVTASRAQARSGDRPVLPKRFYEKAASAEREGGHALTLDGRSTRTPSRRTLIVPTRALADAIAAEWNAQADFVDPATMPLTRIANSAIDGVADDPEAVRADLLRYAGSDLVCYRAGEPAGLVADQTEHWDPVLAWVRSELGAGLVMSLGVMFVQQPDIALARIRAALALETSGFGLAALHVMTTLTGSVLISLMHARGALAADAAWKAAHLDEHHQERLWGLDYEAGLRREARRAEFLAACAFLALQRAD